MIGLTQGSYGQHGNLELVVPDPVDGFRVHWFNGDDEPAAGVSPREWSGGLHVPTGERLDAVRISQVPYGPDFLEVVGRSAGWLRRWYWTPADGFVGGGTVAEVRSSDPAPVVAADGGLHTVVATSDGEVVHVASDVVAYPEVRWTSADVVCAGDDVHGLDLCVDPGGRLVASVARADRVETYRLADSWSRTAELPGHWRGASTALTPAGEPHLVAVDAAGTATLLRPTGTRPPRQLHDAADAAAVSWSTLDGGRLEVVLYAGNDRRHLRLAADT